MDPPDGIRSPQSAAMEENSELGKRRSCLSSKKWLREKFANVQTLYLSFSEGNVERSVFAQEVEELLLFLRSEDMDENSTKRAEFEVENVGTVLGDPNAIDSNDKPMRPSVGAALCNELILKATFKYLSLADLKDCKQVNKVWSKMSSETMAGRYTFIKAENIRSTVLVGKFEDPFNELRACMEQSQHCWAAPGLVLDSDAWTLNAQAQSFLQTFGPCIKRVIVEVPGKAPLLKLLEESLPNVASIELVDRERSEEELNGIKGPLFSQGAALPCLKYLKLPIQTNYNNYYDYAIRAILSAAVNLEVIQRFHSRFTEDLVRLKKLHTVLQLDVVWHGSFLTKELATTKFPNLTKIQVEMDAWMDESEKYRRRGNFFLELCKRFLSLHRSTAEELKVSALAHMREILPPQMPNLRILTLADHYEKGTDLELYEDTETIFPALKEIHVEGPEVFYHDWVLRTKRPLRNDFFSQVEVLVYRDSYPAESFGSFPNVTSLHVSLSRLTCLRGHHDGDLIMDVADEIWNLKLPLKILEFTDLSLVEHNSPDCFDSFFTGIPERVCANLRERPKLDFDLGIFRATPSIGNYKDLRQFKLNISNVKTTENQLGVLSHVSQWYGFGCIPDLQVVISYDFRDPGAPKVAKAIEGILPFVTVVHKEEQARDEIGWMEF